MNLQIEKILNIAKKSAFLAGDAIRTLRENDEVIIKFKGEVNLITTADLRAEEIILAEIKKEFPEHLILSEEGSPEIEHAEDLLKPLWIVDPVDGTTNYAHGLKEVGVSIAFSDKGKVQMGVVHCPFLNETFTAVLGKGAKLNDKPICVSNTHELKSALVGTGFPYERDTVDYLLLRMKQVLLNCQDIRRSGSAAIDTCWVASGRMDAYYEVVCPWDIAAAGLIAREAGALTGNPTPENALPASPFKSVPIEKIPEDLLSCNFLAANPSLFYKMKELLSV